MHREKTEIYCAECGTWLVLADPEGTVTCDCGSQFTITSTPVPERQSKANRTPSPRGHPIRRDMRQRVELNQ